MPPEEPNIIGPDDPTAVVRSVQGRSESFEPVDPTPNTLGSFILHRRIGAGGMGEVYEATQYKLERKVAVKVIPIRQLTGAPREAERAVALFAAEARFQGQLKHDNIVRVILTDAQSAMLRDGSRVAVPYLAMDLVPNARTLRDHLHDRRPDLPEKLGLFRQVLSGVAHAHSQGIVHRDLKPRNVLVAYDAGSPGESVAKVIDFGLACECARNYPSHEPRPRGLRFQGSLPYLAPEQYRAEEADFRSDVYALGVMLYEMTTGELPYATIGRGPDEVIRLITDPRVAAVPPEQRWPEIPTDLAAVIRKAIEKNPEDRYESVSAFRADIDALLAGRPPSVARGDTVSRVAWRVRHGAGQRPLVALFVVTLLAALAALGLSYPVTAPVQRAFASAFVETARADRLSDVRIAQVDGDTDFEALARELGVEGVNNEVPRTQRALLGALIRRMADAGARTLVVDLWFPSANPDEMTPEERQASEALAAALQYAESVGASVILASVKWDVDPVSGRPDIEPIIFDASRRWGGVSVSMHAPGMLLTDLAVQREGEDVMPSLALAGFAADRHPGAIARYSRAGDFTEVRFVSPASSEGSVGAAVAPAVRIPVSGWQLVEFTDSVEALTEMIPGDRAALLMTALPATRVFEDAARGYPWIARADPVSLRRFFAGKAVVICNARPLEQGNVDWHAIGSGRTVPGGYLHAAALQTLILGAGVFIPPQWVTLLSIAGGALLGAGLGALLARTPWWAGLAVAAVIAIAALVAVLLFRIDRVLWNPVGCGLAALLGAALAVVVWSHPPGLPGRKA